MYISICSVVNIPKSSSRMGNNQDSNFGIPPVVMFFATIFVQTMRVGSWVSY
jgi:hypothetical protein